MSTVLKPKMKTRWVTDDARYELRPYRAQAIAPVATGESEQLPSAVSNDSTSPIIALPNAAEDHDRRRGPIERLDAFLDRDFPPLDWRVERLLPAEGVAVLLGKEKSGKTFFSIQQSLCIAAGVPFLGLRTTKARVLLVEEEGSKRRLQERIRRQADGLGIETRGLELYPVFREGLRLETTEDQAYLRSVIRDYEPQVVIMGPLAQLFSLEDENAASDMGKVTRFMNGLAGEFGAVIQLAHHMNKNVNVRGQRSQFFDGARGSSALMGAVDAGIGLGRMDGDKAGSLHLRLRDDEGWSFKFRWDGDQVLFVRDDSAAVVEDESTATESLPHGEDEQCLSLLTYLADNPWTSCSTIDRQNGLPSKNTARTHLDAMVPDVVQRQRVGKADLYAVADETSLPPTL